MKVLVHDGIGVWLAARRLNQGKFVWPRDGAATLTLTRAQLDALVLGLPWARIGEAGVITRAVERARRIQLSNVPMRMCAAAGKITLRDRRQPRHAQPGPTARCGSRADGRSRRVASKSHAEIAFKQATIDKLTHEMAVLKRLKFAAKSEAFNAEQKSLIEETIDTDLAALAQEIEQRAPSRRHKATSSNPSAPCCRRRSAAHGASPRARQHHLRLRLPIEAHRRRRGREAGLHARRVHGRASRPRQVGLHEVRDAGAGAGASAHHRQGHPHDRRCWPRCWWPSTWTTCRCTARKPSSGVPGWRIPDRRWRSWVGQCGVQLQPLVDALKAEMLNSPVLHADETPVAMLKPGNGEDTPGLHLELLHHGLQTRCARWCSTSPRVAAARMCASFLGLPAVARRAGTASWCATTSAATKPASSWA